MCGRFTIATPEDMVAATFGLDDVPLLPPRYNVAPTQDVPVVRSEHGRRQLRLLRWGLVPSWAKDVSMGSRLINARAETVAERPAFRSAFCSRRCLVVADGFYEWRREGGGKRPFFIHFADGRPFAFAGLWETWKGGGRTIESCTIVTCPPNSTVAPIHERMPVILPAHEHGAWLGEDQPAQVPPETLLLPWAGGGMEAFPVSRLVNDPTNDLPACRERLERPVF